MQVKISGLDELIEKFKAFPGKLSKVMLYTMEAALTVLWEKVGKRGYPPPPEGSRYIRTGTLGRSIGITGKPDIFESKTMGSSEWQGEFGSSLGYAKYVIGDQQAHHMTHWWILSREIVQDSLAKIKTVFDNAMEEMAKWIDQQ